MANYVSKYSGQQVDKTVGILYENKGLTETEKSQARINLDAAKDATGTASEEGLTKLYTETGSAADGTMTQKAITDKLNEKIKASFSDGTLILSI